MYSNLKSMLMPHMPKAHLQKIPSGMPTHQDLNAVSPGMHVARTEAPIPIPTATYNPEVLGPTPMHKYAALQHMLMHGI